MNDYYLAIISYNVYWKTMDINNSENHLRNKLDLINYKKNILENIKYSYYHFNPDIYCFQEAHDYSSIINIFDKKKYNYHINISEKDVLLTIWNNQILKLIKVFDDEFEKGRPFSIFLFFNTKTNKYIIFINIHASHQEDTLKTIFKPIQENIDKNFKKYSIKRIIIGGDFNRDINSYLKNNKYFLIINKKKYFFKENYNNNKTCCDIFNKKYEFNSDQVIDTKSSNIITFQLDKFIWYKKKSSDHIMILAIIY
jgi:hypothetical protein